MNKTVGRLDSISQERGHVSVVMAGWTERLLDEPAVFPDVGRGSFRHFGC